MAEQRCSSRRPCGRPAVECAPMERPEPMNRYISPTATSTCTSSEYCTPCVLQQNQVLLEQLAELSTQQNQLLIDLIGAVNALTAALLTARAQI